MTEYDEAVLLANRVLDRPNADPDDDLAMLSRQFLRQAEAVERLRAGIRKHMNQRGDDRCHLDDGELYALLPEGDTRPAVDTAVTLENCRRFIACRQQGREYVSPERELERLRAEADRLRQELAGSYDPMADLIQANRDATLRQHEEAVSRVRRCLARGDVPTALQVLDALTLFHPMHGESWRGWPEGSEP